MLLNHDPQITPSPSQKPTTTLNRAVSAPEHLDNLTESDHLPLLPPKRIKSSLSDQAKATLFRSKSMFLSLASSIGLKSRLSSISQHFTTIKRLLFYFRDKKTSLLITFLAVIVTCAAQVMIPILTSQMIDKRNSDEFQTKVLQFIVICLVLAGSEFLWSFYYDSISQSIRWSLKQEAYTTLINREIEFHDRKQIPEMLEFLDTKVSQIEKVFPEQFLNVLRYSFQLVSNSYLLASISYKLVLVLICSVPLHLIIPLIYEKIRKRVTAKEQQTWMASSRKVMEALQNIKIIRAFSTEDQEIDKFEGLQVSHINAANKTTLAWAVNMAFMGFYINLNLICIVYAGMYLVINGEVTIGSLSGFLMLSIGVASAFRDVSLNYIAVKRSISICEEFFHLLDEKSKIPSNGGTTMENFKGKIEFKNVSFHYPLTPDVQVLNEISFTIAPGESAAFVGMSGGGKSTIISLLLRYYDVKSGEVKLDGVDLREMDLVWLHHQIGFVSQDPILFSGTIEENVSYGLVGYKEEALLRAIKMANAEFVFNKDKFPEGVKSSVGERGSRLSGGQKQRIAIARALMREPKILILDEATSNLDANAEHEVQEAIDNLLASTTITVVTIAHRLSTIKKCKTIFVLKAGEIIEHGSHEKLLELGGAYKTLVKKQFQDHH